MTTSYDMRSLARGLKEAYTTIEILETEIDLLTRQLQQFQKPHMEKLKEQREKALGYYSAQDLETRSGGSQENSPSYDELDTID